MALKEKELIAGLRKKDRFTLQDIINEYANDIYSYMSQVLGYKGMRKKAERAAVETFKYIWNDFKKYNKESSALKTWVFLVAKEQAGLLTAKKDKAAEIEIDSSMGKKVVQIIQRMDDRELEMIVRKYFFYQPNPSLAGYFELSPNELNEELTVLRKKIIEVVDIEDNDKAFHALFDTLSYGLVEEILDKLDIDFDDTLPQDVADRIKEVTFREIAIRQPKQLQKRDDYKWILFVISIALVIFMYKSTDSMKKNLDSGEDEVIFETSDDDFNGNKVVGTVNTVMKLDNTSVKRIVITTSKDEKKDVTDADGIKSVLSLLKGKKLVKWLDEYEESKVCSLVLYGENNKKMAEFTNNAVVYEGQKYMLTANVDYNIILYNADR